MHSRISLVVRCSLVVSSLALVTPRQLRAQESLCTPGVDLEVRIDGRWWPGHVTAAPSNGECPVSHHAYFGTENTSFVTFDKIRPRGSSAGEEHASATKAVPAPTRATAPKTVPATRPSAAPLPAPVPVTRAGAIAEVPRGIYVMVDGMGNLRYRTFLPGGVVYSGVPNGGADVFSVADARAGDARHLGTYALNGGTLTIRWTGTAAAETKSYAMRGADLMLDGYRYTALLPYPSGHRLDGRYTTRAYNSMGVAGGGAMTWGGASSVTLRLDGTFDAARAGMASSSAGNGASGKSEEAANGRYTIRGNTITFTFSDGSVQRSLIHPWKGEEGSPRPSSFNLNGHTYTRS